MATLRKVWRRWNQFSPLIKPKRLRATVSTDLDKPEPPNGFLFNEKPLLPGEKRQKEEWENLWVYGMGLNFILFLVVCIWKPDTSISAWGRKKALERLEEAENSG